MARYDGPSNHEDRALAIAVDGTGNIYVTGRSFGFGYDYATVKYDASGVEQWVVRYDGPGGGGDYAVAIAIDNAGNIYVTGRSYGSGTDIDYATVKYDSLGIEQWVARYDGPGNGYDHAEAIAIDNKGNIYVTGGSYGSGTYSDYATIKYSSTGIREDMVTRVKNNYFSATIFSGHLQLPKAKKCKVFDITGRVVEPDKIQPGIYFIEVDGVVTQKVVKVR
ncbi:SBBP repeat-containing protein [candidate division WOR-3 bacterium]|nr:SBBP repeat-containing protein [candidate division WOR-3 bacterium]